MSSVKVKFRPSSSKERQGTIYYQVIHKRIIRQINTGYYIYACEWNQEQSVAEASSDSRENYIREINRRIDWDIKRINYIFAVLDKNNTDYTSDDVVFSFRRKDYEQSMLAFMKKIIEQLQKAGRYRTSETYTSALKSFSAFTNNHDVLLYEIDSEMMFQYESYLKNKGLMRNTSSFYMRILRAVYNRAVYSGLVEQNNPFRQVYTGIDKTFKRAISMKEIKRIKELKLDNKTLDFARDMFMFSFYTRGMSFVDMAYLTSKNISDGMLVYQRRKTGRTLCIRWEDCMQDIVDKYSSQCSGYLLPIIKNSESDTRRQYKNRLLYIDRNLKKIAILAGIHSTLTLYVARHSWASIAKSKNIPLAVISEALGHESEETTTIYLSSLDNNQIDKANSQILKSIL